VRSLGWVEIAEEDLTPERSSKAVNKCIVDLSVGKNDLLDVVGRWGDGKDLFMDLDEGALKLIDPENLTVLNTQPIHTIRVWGVGRDNGRDFAYVARDRSTRKHMCHVFRCDMPARTIANTLRDICKKNNDREKLATKFS
jgi:amyloid beta (A4) precursor protein-binding family B protein 2 (Fe65-like)